MTWEEIIIQIRQDSNFKDLVELAYFEENLSLNVERFRKSEEYAATIDLIRQYISYPHARIVDVGAGNGIAAVSFAICGNKVVAVEPDPSETIGAGAINKLKSIYKLPDIEVIQAWGEQLPLEKDSFDLVYIRQAMHHANELNAFIKEAARLLRPGGILFTCRDHVIYNEKDKEWFLKSHPLHKYYGGENAFKESEYDAAMIGAGLLIRKKIHHYESVINYFPESTKAVEDRLRERRDFVETNWRRRTFPPVRNIGFLKRLYFERAERKLGPALDERKIPGRLITYIAQRTK